MRQALGIGVFSGIMGVTLFGLVVTPVFYIVSRILAERRRPCCAGRRDTERRAGPTTGRMGLRLKRLALPLTVEMR